MVSPQVMSSAPGFAQAGFPLNNLLARLRWQEADFRRQFEASSFTGGPARRSPDIVYAIAADGRVYALDPSVTPARRIDTPQPPQRQTRRPDEDAPFFDAAAVTRGDLFSSLIQLSSAQMAEIFGKPAAVSTAVDCMPCNDNLQSAATSEPVRAAQFVSSLARNVSEEAPEPVRVRAATSVASFYAALGNTPLLVRNLIDIAA